MDGDEEVEALRAGVSLALRRLEPDLGTPWYGAAGPRSALGPVGELRLVLAGHDGEGRGLYAIALADGRFAGGGAHLTCDLRDEDLLVTVALALQDCLLELLQVVWPMCPVHRVPAGIPLDEDDPDAATAAGPPRAQAPGSPTWWCQSRRSPHLLGPVGALNAPSAPDAASARRR